MSWFVTVQLAYVYGNASYKDSTAVFYSRTNSWSNRRGSKGPAVYAQRAIHGQGHWNGGYDKKPLAVTYSGPEHLNVPPQTIPPTQVCKNHAPGYV